MDLEIDKTLCTNCGKCDRVCLMVTNFGFSGIIQVPEEYCIRCGQCAAVCPVSAIGQNEIRSKKALPQSTPCGDEVLNLIIKNRTLRQYKNKQIPDDVWNKVITAVRYSSSSMNFQEVELIIIQNKEKINEISREVFKTLTLMGTIYRNPLFKLILFLKYSEEALTYLKINAHRKNRIFSGQKDPVLYGAPALILFAGPQKLPSAKDDCDIAAVNVNLLAASLGLGCCYIGGIPHTFQLRKKRIKQAIPLPRDYTIYQALAMGYPRFAIGNTVQRKEKKVLFL